MSAAKKEIAEAFEVIAEEVVDGRQSVAEVKPGKGRARLLKVVDKTGKVTGYTTHAKVIEAVALAIDVEIAVADGKRPTRVKCIACGALREVKGGHLPKRCIPCAEEKDRASRAAWAAANPEKVRANKRARRAANPEKVRADNAAYQDANREKVRAAAAVYRAANPEKLRAAAAAYAAANIEKLRASRATHYAANPEKERARTAAYAAANPEKARARDAKYRAKKKAKREAAKTATEGKPSP